MQIINFWAEVGAEAKHTTIKSWCSKACTLGLPAKAGFHWMSLAPSEGLPRKSSCGQGTRTEDMDALLDWEMALEKAAQRTDACRARKSLWLMQHKVVQERWKKPHSLGKKRGSIRLSSGNASGLHNKILLHRKTQHVLISYGKTYASLISNLS